MQSSLSSSNASSSPPDAGGQPTAASKFTFRLWHLIYVTAILACSFALGGWWSLWFLVAVTAAVVWIDRGLPGKGYVALVVATIVIASALYPKVQNPRPVVPAPAAPAPIPTSGESNLKSIRMAHEMYRIMKEQNPPRFLTDKTGRPIHSWRVLVLPYLNERTLFDSYRFNEPWDGPNNKKLISKMPRVYEIPVGSSDSSGRTHVVALTREKAKRDQSHDSSAGTDRGAFSIVAIPQKSVIWTEPSDLSEDELCEILLNATPKDYFDDTDRGQANSPQRVGGYASHASRRVFRIPYPFVVDSDLANGLGLPRDRLGLPPHFSPRYFWESPEYLAKFFAAVALCSLLLLPVVFR